jgi:hypothetical protein
LSLVLLAILLKIAPCCAESQSGLFRLAFSCPDRAPSSICVFGTIPRGKQVTLLAEGWKSSAAPKKEFPNTETDSGVKTNTYLQVAAPPPKGAYVIAVLATAEAVNELPKLLSRE